MKGEHIRPASFVASGFFVLRTPALPEDTLETWSSGLAAPSAGADPSLLEPALAADRARLRASLRAALRDPFVREAIFVASPSLFERLDVWEEDPASAAGVDVERPLVRYFERMASRPTPFGLFAGCSVGAVGAETHLVVAARAHHRRHTRLDVHYLTTLASALSRAPELRGLVRVRVNDSAHRAGGRLRFLEARTAPGARDRVHLLVAAAIDEHLDLALRRSAAGALPAEIVEALAGDGISADEAEEYVASLIDARVLVSDLEAAATGALPLAHLVDELRSHPAGGRAARGLEAARSAMAALDDDGLGSDPARYRSIAGGLAELPVEFALARLFHVDLIKPSADATLGADVAEELARGAELLRRIGGAGRDDALDRFRGAFARRYEAQEVPLVEVLDEESGVGLGAANADAALGPSPLLDDLELDAEPKELSSTWTERDTWLLQRVTEAASRGHVEIALDEADIARLEQPSPPLPDAFAVVAKLAARSAQALSAGDFRVWLQGASGPSGALLLGRFCEGNEALRRLVEEHLRAEEALRPEAIFAEIVHLPQGRLGNVVSRPPLRAYEIPYLGRASVPPERQIPVSDLMVSVRAERVVLRSRSRGKEVLPRLSCAHNFARGDLGLYRFLCMLQHQGSSRPSWSWGPLAAAPQLPRVTHGRLLLAPARWRLARADLDALKGRGSSLFRSAQELRTRRSLPRCLLFVDADNTLPLDFDNILSLEALAAILKERRHAVFFEAFPSFDEQCASGVEGRFAHEVVVPFVRSQSVVPPHEVRAPTPTVLSTPRRFPPGSEWLYAKLYAGPAAADALLRRLVRPVVDAALAQAASDRWFFLRYGDPDWHLRLRFHGEPRRLHQSVLPILHDAAAAAMRDGILWRYELGTYDREVERYGGPHGIAAVEELFRADSDAVLALVEGADGDAGAEARWRLALCGMDRLLDDLGLDLGERVTLLVGARAALLREHRAGAPVERRLDRRYRAERASLEALLDPARSGETGLAWAIEVLRKRSDASRSGARALRDAASAGRLSVPLPAIAHSLVHLHVNRLVRSAARAHELVLCDFLARLYASKSARCRFGQTNGADPRRPSGS